MGFGHLLTFMVEGILAKLGHYGVDRHLDNVTPLDVCDNSVRRWRESYPGRFIAPTEIVLNIGNAADVDNFNFRLDSLMLFLTITVECYKQGRRKETILSYLTEETDLSDIDWCAYIIESIRDCKVGWKRCDPGSPFAGPLTILADEILQAEKMFSLVLENKKILETKNEELYKKKPEDEEVLSLVARYNSSLKRICTGEIMEVDYKIMSVLEGLNVNEKDCSGDGKNEVICEISVNENDCEGKDSSDAGEDIEDGGLVRTVKDRSDIVHNEGKDSSDAREDIEDGGLVRIVKDSSDKAHNEGPDEQENQTEEETRGNIDAGVEYKNQKKDDKVNAGDFEGPSFSFGFTQDGINIHENENLNDGLVGLGNDKPNDEDKVEKGTSKFM
ncbi:hypothetical protein L1987_60217 [Smallanthus sonchifolius]|uniref:Uncharacterized protein n=1 Tax=Smallanthus sonchifolius TaxID=185202 RepID=A0ACB9D7J3_9ASTR|nr:hypothetical protein L1987_60217 [Smallanthus sonchifolius]